MGDKMKYYTNLLVLSLFCAFGYNAEWYTVEGKQWKTNFVEICTEEAMVDNASILHDSLTTKELGDNTGKVSNIAEHFQHSKGDITKGFAEADVIVEREFKTVTVHQGYLEPHNGTAIWNPDGRIHVWCSTQGSFAVRDSISDLFGIPVSQIRVTPMEIGGGFGGENTSLCGTRGRITFKNKWRTSQNCNEPKRYV